MTFYIRKIVLGLALSCAGIVLSYAWYKFDLSRSKVLDTENKKTVAHLSESKNEVQKKQANRVIWQSVDIDEALHAGEAVRTSADSEAKIIFNSGAQVQMDPDSVVVIEEVGDKINLDFVKGNLFFKGGGKKDQLGLRSGSTNIDLKNGEVALNKSQDGKALDVQVLRGTAELSQGDKKVLLDTEKGGTVDEKGLSIAQQFLKAKAPLAFSKMYIQTAKKEPVVFEWEKLPENFDVYLEIGDRREKLSRMYPKVSGKLGMMAMQLKLGNYFWRLVAVDNKDATKIYYTPVNKISVLAEVAPKLIQPADDSVATLSAQTQTLSLRWSNPSKLEKLHVEISKDAQFSKNVYSEQLADTGVHEAAVTEDGVYYWRVAGFRAGTSREVVSNSGKFILKTKLELLPPQLKEPKDGSRVQIENIQNGLVFLKWDPVLGYNQYQIKVALGDKLVFEQKVNDVQQVRFTMAKPGSYKWAISTLNAEGNASQLSQQRLLIVEELPQLIWADSKQQDQYFYLTEKPQMRVALKPLDKARSYKITYKLDEAKPIEKTLMSSTPDKIFDIPSDGLYKVFVEALNEKSQVIARSFTKDIVIQPRPLLPPPEFAQGLPDLLQASKKGVIDVSFKAVGGAKAYYVNLKNTAGKISKQEKLTATSGTLKGLLPGNYKISLSSIDEYGRPGPAGKEKLLNVPNTSDSKAPKLRKLKVK